MTFQINGRITNEDNAEMLATLVYLKNNYVSKIASVNANGDNKEVQFTIVDAIFDDAVNTINALISKYGDGVRLKRWQIQFRDLV